MAEDVPLRGDLVEVSREVAVAIQRCQAADIEKIAAYNSLAEMGAAITAAEQDVADVIASFLLGGQPAKPPAIDPNQTTLDLVTEDTFRPEVEAPAPVAAEPEVVEVDEPYVDQIEIVNDVDLDEDETDADGETEQ